MLITELKSKETIASLVEGKKVFIINCHGCKEVHFPEKEAVEFEKELAETGNVTGIMTKDYICNPENMKLRLEKHMGEIKDADVVLVCSCGVGVQTVSEYLEDKKSAQHVIPIHCLDSRELLNWNTTANSAATVT